MTKDKLKKNNKSGLKRQLTSLTIIPLIIMGLIIMVVTYIAFYKNMSKSMELELKNTVLAIERAYADVYDKEYSFSLSDDGRYLIDKDEADIDISLINEVRQISGSDITLFYYDIRIATTITDKNGESLIGTVASKKIVDAVINGKKAIFVDNASVNDNEYFGYYSPVLNDSGECIGMIFAGKPNGQVKKNIMISVCPVFAVIIFMIFFVSLKSASVAKKLADTIGKEKDFLGEIAAGNLKATLDASVIKRDDELGEMGRFTVRVLKFIKDMIERDTLTKLYTRRIGEVKLECSRQEYIDYGSKYCIVMCDIDHFKNFNDSYGHDCGDLVLQAVAHKFNRLLFGKGYAIRWGGEEFILVIENSDLEKALPLLEDIRNAVLENEVIYNDECLKVTMTYGIILGDDRELLEMIKEVDNLLYCGKEGGRNQIVVQNNN